MTLTGSNNYSYAKHSTGCERPTDQLSDKLLKRQHDHEEFIHENFAYTIKQFKLWVHKLLPSRSIPSDDCKNDDSHRTTTTTLEGVCLLYSYEFYYHTLNLEPLCRKCWCWWWSCERATCRCLCCKYRTYIQILFRQQPCEQAEGVASFWYKRSTDLGPRGATRWEQFWLSQLRQ